MADKQDSRPATTLVHPKEGVTLYVGGKHTAFEPGRPVPVPTEHADDLVAGEAVITHDDVLARQKKAAEEKAAEQQAAEKDEADRQAAIKQAADRAAAAPHEG